MASDGPGAPDRTQLAAPTGPAPHVAVEVRAVGVAEHGVPALLEGSVSAPAPVSDLLARVASCLGKFGGAVVLMAEGQTLDPALSLEENGVLIPAPARRRAGGRVELRFSLEQAGVDAVVAEQEAQVRREQELADEAAEVVRRKMQKEETAKRNAEFDKKSKDLFKPVKIPTVAERINEFVAAIHALPQPTDEPPRPTLNLEVCDEAVRHAVGLLMDGCGRTKRVVGVIRNESDALRWRYERVKTALGSCEISRRQTQTATFLHEHSVACSALGTPLDDAVNETYLFHGTGTLEGVGGILRTGFDMAFSGSHGSAWSPGFYFADNTDTPSGYCKMMRGFSVMLVCRVVLGRVRDVEKHPNAKEQEELTASCLGPGGVFGSKSDFHSIRGSSYCYVCMHRDQVYPEYAVFFDT